MKKTIMENTRLMMFIAICIAVTILPSIAGDTKEAKQQEVRSRAENALSRLYELRPSAKAGIESAAGYGVFSNFGMKIFVAGGGKGKGIVVNNKTKKETFMKMLEVQAGLLIRDGNSEVRRLQLQKPGM
jgi:hypothetical protein